MHFPLLTDAVQNRLAAGLCQCKYTYEDLLFIQVCGAPKTNALQHCSGQDAFPTAQCCSAEQADSRLVPWQIHLCRFALHTGLHGTKLMHSNTAKGRMHFPLLSAALQNRLTAGLCQCKYTYGDSRFIQVCMGPN